MTIKEEIDPLEGVGFRKEKLMNGHQFSRGSRTFGNPSVLRVVPVLPVLEDSCRTNP